MGFFNSSMTQLPGAGGYINAVSDWANNLNPSLNFAGRQAKKGLKALGEGNYDSNPTLSGYFAPIRDMYATSEREGERGAAMGVGAKWGQDNPVLAQRVSQLNEERSREAEGQAMTRMIPQLNQGFSNTFQNAANERTQELGMQGQGLQSAMQAWMNSFYQKPSTFSQIAGPLAQLGQGAGSIGAGFFRGKV